MLTSRLPLLVLLGSLLLATLTPPTKTTAVSATAEATPTATATATPDLSPPAIVTAPFVQTKTDTTAVIAWETDEPSTSEVIYGTNSALSPSFVVSGTNGVTLHQVTLTGLQPDTLYYFKVQSVDRFGNSRTSPATQSFRTNPAPVQPDTTPPTPTATGTPPTATATATPTITATATGSPTAEATIQPTPGTTQEVGIPNGQGRLLVPGAAAGNSTLKVTVQLVDPPAVPTAIAAVRGVKISFAKTADNSPVTELEQDVTIEISYGGLGLTNDQISRLVIYNVSRGEYLPTTIDRTRGVAIARTRRFSTFALAEAVLPIPRATLTGLVRNVGGISSGFVVANQGASAATVVNMFYDNAGMLLASASAIIAPGQSAAYYLGTIAYLPDGYSGYLVISSAEPITATLLTPPTPTATPTATATSIQPMPQAGEAVRVANLTDVAFTLSWVTPFTSTGSAVVVPVGGGSPLNAVDVRGADFAGDTHDVRVRGLLPTTAYAVAVYSGDTLSPTAVLTVSTGPTIAAIPPVDTIRGFLYQADGFTPAAGAIVYLHAEDADGQGSAGRSALLSALVGADGSWLIDLPPRRLDLQDYFSSGSGDRFRLFAEGAHRGALARSLPATGSRLLGGLNLVPGEPVSLQAGWTLLALPDRAAGPYTAASLLAELAGQGLGPRQIARWQDGRWESHVRDFPANDFPIEPGRGYFVWTSSYGTWFARPRGTAVGTGQ